MGGLKAITWVKGRICDVYFDICVEPKHVAELTLANQLRTITKPIHQSDVAKLLYAFIISAINVCKSIVLITV